MNELINSTKIEKGTDYVPIGTVLYVENIKQAVMVYGRKQVQEGNGRVWDYVACPYPQGYLSADTNVFFDHEHISEIAFKGFDAEGERIMKQSLQALFDKDE